MDAQTSYHEIPDHIETAINRAANDLARRDYEKYRHKIRSAVIAAGWPCTEIELRAALERAIAAQR